MGGHSTNNINDGYLGSGKILKYSIKKYGKENHKIERLEFFDTKKQSFNAQEKHILKYNTLVPAGYNISPKGGVEIKGGLSEESKLKISESRMGKPHIQKKIKCEYCEMITTQTNINR